MTERKKPVYWTEDNIKTARRLLEADSTIAHIVRVCNVFECSVNRIVKKIQNSANPKHSANKTGQKRKDHTDFEEMTAKALLLDNSLTLSMRNDTMAENMKRSDSFYSKLLKKMAWSQKSDRKIIKCIEKTYIFFAR